LPGNFSKKKIVVWLLLLAGQCLLTGCRTDLLGLFVSTDLDKRLEARNSFRFPAPGDREVSLGDDFAFLVVGDTHIENGNVHGFEKLRDIIAADTAIRFVVVTGDITQNGKRKDIEKFIEIAGSFGIPCYPVIGNHDIFFNNWQHWKELIGSTRYRIDAGGATLFFLDSANYFFGRDQLNWLENGLKSAAGRVFVFTHVNLFAESPLGIKQQADAREIARITSILRGRCDIMFMGHIHTRDIKEMGGVRYIVVDGFRNDQIYCRVSVTGSGISYRFEKL
jgi:predicted phosphodiesterase